MKRTTVHCRNCCSCGKRNRQRKDAGFTGLEAAIVLIAFIVVASVFSYMVLNTGFFVTQKSQNVIFAAVEQTTSTLFISGNVIGVGQEGNTRELDAINFTCSISPSGSPVDFEKVVLTFSNTSRLETLTRDPATYNPAGCSRGSGSWAVYQRNSEQDVSNLLLEPGEQFVVSACPAYPAISGDTFTLEVKPAIGVSLSISRTVPAEIRPVTRLH